MYTKLVSPIFSYETKRLVFEKMRFHKKVVGVAFLYTSANNRGGNLSLQFCRGFFISRRFKKKFGQLWTFCQLDKDGSFRQKMIVRFCGMQSRDEERGLNFVFFAEPKLQQIQKRRDESKLSSETLLWSFDVQR
jgi:hypothetical protein